MKGPAHDHADEPVAVPGTDPPADRGPWLSGGGDADGSGSVSTVATGP